MKKYTLLIGFLLFLFVQAKTQTNSNNKHENPAKEFLNGYTSKYSCDGTGKGKGLKFSIKYPQSWISEEGNRPHIVRKFSNENLSVSAMLILNDLGYIPPKSEIDDYLSEESAKEMIPEGGYYIKSNQTIIDGAQTLVLDFSTRREKLGTIIKTRMRMYSIIYKSYLLQVQFSVSQVPYEPPVDLEKGFNEYEMLFNAMINSLIIVSKYEN
jgi:hypothetical protein